MTAKDDAQEVANIESTGLVSTGVMPALSIDEVDDPGEDREQGRIAAFREGC